MSPKNFRQIFWTQGFGLLYACVCLQEGCPGGIVGYPMVWAAHGARWARCRNAHLSSFARQVNLGLNGHRGLASCPPLTRICAELQPVHGFVEQRAKTPGALEPYPGTWRESGALGWSSLGTGPARSFRDSHCCFPWQTVDAPYQKSST